ncbi:hypothetical protein BGW37DRAFT_131698 [Umbelopsis sp. PMI_123]|nr:hypothetical protein BGW37DRAFT_131698 [Umbelopsis sp. PMI_123]
MLTLLFLHLTSVVTFISINHGVIAYSHWSNLPIASIFYIFFFSLPFYLICTNCLHFFFISPLNPPVEKYRMNTKNRLLE